MTTPASSIAQGTSIRLACAADLDAVVEIERRAFETDRISRRSFSRLIRSRTAAVLVAQGRSGILGCAVLLFRSYSRRARLYSLAMSLDARGKGIGTLLLAASERIACERGAEAVGLEVRADNAAAAALYERHGYRLLGKTSNYYSDAMTALHLHKTLPQRPEVA